MLLCPIENTGVLSNNSWIQRRPRITQLFGLNPQIYEQFNMKGHNGIDYGVPIGTPVYAAHDGECLTKSDSSGYGIHVKIRSDFVNPKETIYAHLSSTLVKTGQKVFMGDLIGYSGNTGFSTGPHLHFGLRRLIPDSRPIFQWHVRDYGNGYLGWVDPIDATLTWKGTSAEASISNETVDNPPVATEAKDLKPKVKVQVLLHTLYFDTTYVLNAIKEYYKYHIDIEFNVKSVDIPVKFTNGAGGGSKVAQIKTATMLASIAEASKDSHIVALLIPPYLNAATDLLGWFFPTPLKGKHFLWCEASVNSNRKKNKGWANNSQIAGTLRHELSHAFHYLAKTKDRTHEYEEKGDFGLVLKNLDFSKIKLK